jgi:hypothetical protein
MAVDTQHVVDDVLGTSGDAAVLSYICSCLADEDFDYDETYDVFGDMLVRPVAHGWQLPLLRVNVVGCSCCASLY